jgi:hypothetical protein
VCTAPLRLSVPFPLLTHTHPEDGNNVRRNVEAASAHDGASPKKPKLYDSMHHFLSTIKSYVVYDKSVYLHNEHIITNKSYLY